MKVTKTKKGQVKTKSDHNALFSKFELRWKRNLKPKRQEMYNLKNKDCQDIFNEITDQGTFLSEIFDNIKDINEATNEFIKRLNKVIKKSFVKIRITDKKR